MAPPARKKSRPAYLSDQQTPEAESGRNQNTVSQSPHVDTISQEGGSTASPKSQKRSSWYSPASWKSKALPVAQVARESIQVDKGVSSESPTTDNPNRRPSQSVSKSFRGGSRKSIPLVAEPTKVHANVSDVSLPPKQQRKSSTAGEKVLASETPVNIEEGDNVQPEAAAAGQGMGDDDSKAEIASVRPASGTWFGWWSRPDGYGSDGERVKTTDRYKKVAGDVEEGASNEHMDTREEAHAAGVTEQPVNVEHHGSNELQPETAVNITNSGRSWFRLWSSTQNEQATEDIQHRRASEQQPEPAVSIAVEPDTTTEEVNAIESTKKDEGITDESQSKSSGWAFWSRDRPKEDPTSTAGTQKQIGELAVADTPSQSHPEVAQFNQEREETNAAKPGPIRGSSLLRRNRGRPAASKDASGETTAAATPATSECPTPAASQFQTPRETPEVSPAPVQRGQRAAQVRPNIILPAFRDTYPSAPNPGIIDRLTNYLGQSLRIPGYEAAMSPRHPYISSSPQKVRKAIAIGVHGYFPAPLLQRVIGQPTGTSIRFANYAAASVKQWCHEHQPEVKTVEVEKVALEGQGSIADRVTALWKLLLNWLSQLRQADFILLACHSQGVPVTFMLVAKLIQLGALSPSVRIGVCAMAGVNLGPFPEYRRALFGSTALELFEFSDRNSKVSIAYSDSLDICLRHGVRATFVGSIDDQLVSLESSLHVPLSHPYVSRTVFIDGRLHTSNFLTHLVIFAIKLRNLGISDHGLLREISGPLAGSLVGGEGHSRVYDDPVVYQNAVEFALESTDVAPTLNIMPTSSEDKSKSMEAAHQRRASLAGYPPNMTAANSMRRGSLGSLSLAPPGIAPTIAPYEPPGSVGTAEKNPFVLPWAVRGLLEEDLVKRDPKVQAEVKELVREFEAWRPNSKVLKDVRWRLEGVRSMS